MLALVISAMLFLALAVAIVSYGYVTYVKPARTLQSLAAPIPGLGGAVLGGVRPAGQAPSFQVRQFLQFVGEKVPQDPLTSSLTRRQLMAAGFRTEAALPVFLSLRLAGTALCFLAAVTVTQATSWPRPIEILVWVVAAILGHTVANLALDLIGERYQDILRSSLPDALDLLIVAVEAGLALDQALRKVSEELARSHPEISREFGLVSLETRTGVKRADALRNMADRTMEPEMRKFVAIMIQTDRFGTSIAESLRAHADFMRVRRRQIAEEKANKLGVKLTLVVFFFILPAIMIISGGPAFLKIFKELLPQLRSMGRG